MGYSIQVGAFARVDNAARLTKSLETKGIEAFYFTHSSGLYKVRFGNYPSWKEAAAVAGQLRSSGIIEVYYIVSPGEYVQAKGGTPGAHSLRDEIVATARSFIGLPYQWCDASTNAVLDCSGLALAVYQLNGMNLPRTSADQYASGTPVDKDGLQKGDLVFFATSWFGRISHVGIYIGDGMFIHAPGQGKVIRTESLAVSYYQEHYRGARTYLQ
jgi:cell wall-associated NlpC family hydrolase